MTLPNNLTEILTSAKGQTLTYKQVYELLNIPYTRSVTSRKALINELQLYCDIHDISQPNQHPIFLITEIYNTSLLPPIHKNNKFQLYIEQAFLTLFKDNNLKPIYATNLEILEMLSMVNENFKIVCTPILALKLEDRGWMQSEAWTIYSILYRWADLRLKQMAARGLVKRQEGYRLYRQCKGFTLKFDVPEGCELEEKCRRIYANAIYEADVPNDWDGGWLPPSQYQKLKALINKGVRENLDGWQKMKKINILYPLDDMALIEKNIVDADNLINAEAKRKIGRSSRFDHLADYQKKQLVDEIIDADATVDYKAMIKNKPTD